MAGPTNTKGSRRSRHVSPKRSTNQLETRYKSATPPTPQMIATMAITHLDAVLSRKNIKPA